MDKEDQWINFLKNQSEFILKHQKIVILSPHPDDETLGAGGLIAELRRKNIEVIVFAITDGEHAYSDIEPSSLRKIRIDEQNLALNILGVNNDYINRLSIPDGSIESNEKLLEIKILPYIDKDVLIVAPWTGDFHPDHEAVGRVAIQLAKRANASLMFYFFWTWHHAEPQEISHLPLFTHDLSAEAIMLKDKALNCYLSQLYHPVEPILPPTLLEPVKRSLEVFSLYENK